MLPKTILATDKKRIIKKTRELAYITQAQNITDKILLKLKRWLRPCVTEKDIEREITKIARDLGAESLSFTPIIAINENSASPHHKNSDKKLKQGDIILVDMGVKVNGYCSDMTRMIFTKEPTKEQKAIYELVLKAQETAISKIKAGVTGKKIDAVARDIIAKAGYEKYFGHSLGHGVGLDIHELPNFSKKYEDKIPPGAVVTVEPGVYLPRKFGVRIEDMVIVEDRRARNLTMSPKSIQSCVIRLK